MFLQDIQLSMQRISEYIEGYDFIKFKLDYKTVDAVVRNFEIIGEASKKSQNRSKINIRKFPGKRCIILGTKFLTNITELIIQLSGMLPPITSLRIKRRSIK